MSLRAPGSAGAAPASRAFDFTAHVRLLCEDVCVRLPEFAHVDMARVAVAFSQTRRDGAHGMHASLTPLRFAGGAETTVRRGRRYRIQAVVNERQRVCLYLLKFYLPRFLDLPFEEKLITVCHELWHVGPQFDGDLRRHEGRCFAHGGSREAYDDGMRSLVRQWLRQEPPRELWAFLERDFRGLVARHGQVVGLRIRQPRIVPA